MTPEQRERWMAARYKHGGYSGGKEQPEHYVWRTMIARCTNPRNKQFHYYGGRGIKVCKRWMKYENFISDMGYRPSSEHSLERKDTDGDYKQATVAGQPAVNSKRIKPPPASTQTVLLLAHLSSAPHM